MSASGRLQISSLPFLIKFAALMAVSILIVFFSDPVGVAAADLTLRAVSSFCELFRIPVSSHGGVISLWGFKMNITTDCTAIQYLAIFIAAVLSYPGRTATGKAAGLAAGTALIFSFNILRIVGVGYVGANAPRAFDFVHTYMWQGMFIVFVFVLWVLWANNMRILMSAFYKRVAAAIAASAAAILLLKFSMPYYVSLLASAAEILLSLMPLANEVSVTAYEGIVYYAYDDLVGRYILDFDIYYSASFFAVLAFSLPGLRLRLLNALAGSLVLLVCLHTLSTVAAFFFVDHYLKTREVHYLLWYMRLILIVAPVLIGLWSKGVMRQKD